MRGKEKGGSGVARESTWVRDVRVFGGLHMEAGEDGVPALDSPMDLPGKQAHGGPKNLPWRAKGREALTRPAVQDGGEIYTLKRNRIMSPSWTTYSLPSERMSPFSRAAAMVPQAIRSS